MECNGAKRILDSVHGYINVPKELCDNIIDTPEFQRLRRIEQMSIRSLFPCARHDRFTHSLGVYYLGCKIVQAIKTHLPQDVIKEKELAFECYKLACLLHDVGHSPFSHTFEKYFENSEHNLREILNDKIRNDDFIADSKKYIDYVAPHERMSAYVVLCKYEEYIKSKKLDIELIVRMIIGCKYSDVKNKSFENALIDLIHGEIIDADGLDYVKRDSWASGYNSALVDIERLISAINIKKDKLENWCVCYSHKALNEIESVLSIKTYQQFVAVSHHIVVYEKFLLHEAMKSVAQYHTYGNISDNKEERKKALEKLCNVESLINKVILEKTNYPMFRPTDDDFISLMRFIPEDPYVKQYLSRQYDFVPLWKSNAELLKDFPILRSVKYTENCWLFSDRCKKFIVESFKYEDKNVIIRKVKRSEKRINVSNVKFLINDELVPFNEIFPNSATYKNPLPFAYIFIKKESSKKETEQKIRNIKEALKMELGLYFFDETIDK